MNEWTNESPPETQTLKSHYVRDFSWPSCDIFELSIRSFFSISFTHTHEDKQLHTQTLKDLKEFFLGFYELSWSFT